MKKLLIITLAAIALSFVGCTADTKSQPRSNVWTSHGGGNAIGCATTVVVIEGHRYIIMDGEYSGGIIHAESCPCKH